MMQSKSPLNQFMEDPQAADLLGNPAALKNLMGSADTKKLMELLNRNAGGGLKNAADAAMKGSPNQLMGLMNQLLQDPEGAKVVENLNKSIKK